MAFEYSTLTEPPRRKVQVARLLLLQPGRSSAPDVPPRVMVRVMSCAAGGSMLVEASAAGAATLSERQGEMGLPGDATREEADAVRVTVGSEAAPLTSAAALLLRRSSRLLLLLAVEE